MLCEHDITIAPSTHDARRTCPVSDAQYDDAYLANSLLDLWQRNRGVYGIDKCWTMMQRAGHDVGRDHTSRLMRLIGVSGAVRGRHSTVTTRRGDGATRHPDLIGRAWDTPTRPDQWWVADFT